jgi:adenine-specific DNA-methyltransferase
MSEPVERNLVSASFTDEHRVKLKLLFPEIFTEGGKIAFERLKLALGVLVDTWQGALWNQLAGQG